MCMCVYIYIYISSLRPQELYAAHVEPHMGMAMELYSKSVLPHVETARSACLHTAFLLPREMFLVSCSKCPGCLVPT